MNVDINEDKLVDSLTAYLAPLLQTWAKKEVDRIVHTTITKEMREQISTQVRTTLEDPNFVLPSGVSIQAYIQATLGASLPDGGYVSSDKFVAVPRLINELLYRHVSKLYTDLVAAQAEELRTRLTETLVQKILAK